MVLSLAKKPRAKRRKEFVPPRIPLGETAKAVQRACGIPIAVGRSVVTRLNQGHSPTRIASDVGLHRSTVYRIKNGRKGSKGNVKRHWIHAELAKGSGRCKNCGALLLAFRCLRCELQGSKRPA